MRDQVVIYDQTYDPAVIGAIAPNTTVDLATLNVAQYGIIIEKMYLFPPYTIAALPADLEHVQILVDGQPYPSTPARLYVRGMADRNMAVPFDTRYSVKTVPFGEISTDAVKDTTIKLSPAQTVAVRLTAGGTTGIVVTDTPIRVMLVGRIAADDAELRDIYGGASIYDPISRRLADAVNGKETPDISKFTQITIDNLKHFSGSALQGKPIINPFWTYSRNLGVIPAIPEYPYSFANPANVPQAYMDLRFDWTRTADRALIIRQMGARITAGRGRVWWDQPALRRPGHLNLFFGWVVNAAGPNMLPTGGDIGLTPMFQGPLDLENVQPKILAFNNLTELRVTADVGTTILATNLEIQMRGTHIQW